MQIGNANDCEAVSHVGAEAGAHWKLMLLSLHRWPARCSRAPWEVGARLLFLKCLSVLHLAL